MSDNQSPFKDVSKLQDFMLRHDLFKVMEILAQYRHLNKTLREMDDADFGGDFKASLKWKGLPKTKRVAKYPGLDSPVTEQPVKPKEYEVEIPQMAYNMVRQCLLDELVSIRRHLEQLGVPLDRFN